jgi:hypothetical protein
MIDFFRRSKGEFKIIHSYTHGPEPESLFSVEYEGETEDSVFIQVRCSSGELSSALVDVYRRVKRHVEWSRRDKEAEDQDDGSANTVPEFDEHIRRDEQSIAYWVKTSQDYAANRAAKPTKQLTAHDYASAQILAVEAGEHTLGEMLGLMVLFERHTDTVMK